MIVPLPPLLVIVVYPVWVRYNEVMFIVGILSWWYTTGWKQRVIRLKERLIGTIDYFSIDLLLKTFFSPFRQISAGKVQGSINVQLHAFFDQLISRIIGAIVRTGMIIIGVITILLHLVLGIVGLVVWAIVPLFPLIGVWLWTNGVVLPWKI